MFCPLTVRRPLLRRPYLPVRTDPSSHISFHNSLTALYPTFELYPQTPNSYFAYTATPSTNEIAECKGLWPDYYYYCVGVPGTPTSRPTTTKPTTSPGPSPTQSGIVSNCQRYYQAKEGDGCRDIVDSIGTFTFADFLTWNPAVGADCGGLWVGYYYCIGKSCIHSTLPCHYY